MKHQLKDGIRYLDFRVAPDSHGDFYLVHGLYGASVSLWLVCSNQYQLTEALQQVLRFVKKHPREIIILDFNHFYGMNVELHMKLIAIIHSILDDCLTNRRLGPTSALRDFWKAKAGSLLVPSNLPEEICRLHLLAARNITSF